MRRAQHIIRKLLTLSAIAVLLGAMVPDSMAAESDKGRARVTICHIPPGNPANAHSITVGRPAVRAHLAHGDYVGECSGSDDDDSGDDDTSGGEEHAQGDDDDSDDDEGEQAAAPIGDDDGDDPGDYPDDDVVQADGSPFGSDNEGPCGHLFGEDAASPGFFVSAAGNLDGDGEYAYYYRAASLTPDCQIVGPPRVVQENGLE